MKSQNEYNALWRIAAYVIMVGFTLLTILPLIWLFYSSFKPHADIVRNIFALPTSFNLWNYTNAWKGGNFGAKSWTEGYFAIYTLNSIFFSVATTVITTVLALTTGYGIAKFGYKISAPIYGSFLMGLLLTVHSILVPLFVMEKSIGIYDTRLGVLLPYIAFGLPFLVFLATSFIKGLPAEIEESAIIDGANYLQVFWYVILPICRPVVATMMIFRFLGAWNEFALVLVLTSKTAIRTLPVGINAFAGGMTRDYGTQFAALVIGTLPMIIFYIFFNQRIQQGFASGGLKE